MRKTICCISFCASLIAAFILLASCMPKATYKNTQVLSDVYSENKVAFSTITKVLCKYYSINNLGLIHIPKEGEKDICPNTPDRVFFKNNNIHISSQSAYSDNEYAEIHKAVCNLLTEVDIASIELYPDRIVFTLYDKARNSQSWYPQIVYCLDAGMDESDLWNTSLESDILRLDSQWFAYIIMY